MAFLLCHLLIGCSSNSNLSTLEYLDILEKVQQSPAQASSLCETVQNLEKRDECLLSAVELLRKKDREKTEDLCRKMATSKRGECFFRLAETSQDMSHCTQAKPFQEDCQLHILTKQLMLAKVTTLDEAMPILKRLSLSLQDANTKTVVYRHLLAKEHPIPIQQCSQFPHPKACEMAAEGLYVDRLRHARDTQSFPCAELGALDHQNHSLLEQQYSRFHKEVCP